MGARGSKQSSKRNIYIGKSNGQEKQRQKVHRDVNDDGTAPSEGRITMERGSQMLVNESSKWSYGSVTDDEFYDGIPQYPKNLYQKSKSSRVSEVGSFLGRAGSMGIGRAVDVLDTLGSSMTNLNPSTGFMSGASNKNSELSILAFEVANTIVKGSNLMQSLSKRSIRQLKEVVLPAESVQQLVSKDMNELMEIVAKDKRSELKVFSEEVVRFGNRCKDPQWHNLDRFFEKCNRDRNSQKLSWDVAESMMQQLMNLVQLTAELYQEQHILDRIKQDYQHRRLEELKQNSGQKGDKDNTLSIVAGELKGQKKLVKILNKKSLWSRSMEEIMGQLVDIVLFLNQEINNIFGKPAEGDIVESRSHGYQQTLGHTGLALHYANIILQIDSIVARSSSMTPIARDTLYQSLPPTIKASLRSNLQSFKVEKELSVTQIKDVMERTLCWLVPTATNTSKAHHGFGWVGEWANTGSEQIRKTVAPTDVMKIETLYHADRKKMEDYILDLLLWLNYLVSRSKPSTKCNNNGSSPRKESGKKQDATKSTTVSAPSSLSTDDQEPFLTDESEIFVGMKETLAGHRSE